MTSRILAGIVVAVGAFALLWSHAPAARAQTALRVRGSAQGAGAERLAATVEIEAMAGARGGQFVGQRTFRVRGGADGRWSVLGVTAGIWTFQAHTPSHFPQVVAFPVQFSQRNPSSAVGGQLPWEVGFDLVPHRAHPDLVRTANAVVSGDSDGLVDDLARLEETGAPDALTVAGELALYARQPALARALFTRALADAPGHARARLGLATADVLEGNLNGAARSYWAAREAGLPPLLAKAVGAAITDFQRLGGTGTTPCPSGQPGC